MEGAARPKTTTATQDAGLLARAEQENFTVAPRLLPRRWREDLTALYGFARLVDWAGDEAPGDREALLRALSAELDRLLTTGTAESALVRRLGPTIARHGLPRQPFDDLISANLVDQRVTRYATFDELLDYCALSANPVGRLVLGVFDAATPQRCAASDRVCTALQLAEHWQDVAEDAHAGRVYLPQEDLDRFGVHEAELIRNPASPALRRLLAFEVARARQLLDAGPALVRSLSGAARIAVAGYVAGGCAALDAIERAGFDITAGAPVASRLRRGRYSVALLAGQRP